MYRSLAAEIFLTPSGVAASCREANQSLVSRASSPGGAQQGNWKMLAGPSRKSRSRQPLSHRGDVGSHSTNHRCCSASFAGGGLASC
jgi:hypothetical protein